MRSRHIRRQCDYVHELRGRHILRHDRRDGVHDVCSWDLRGDDGLFGVYFLSRRYLPG